MNRAAGVIEFSMRGWWQGHGEKPQVQLLPTVPAVLQGFGHSPGLEVLAPTSAPESVTSKCASHCAHLAGLRSSPSNTLSPVTASCHGGEGWRLVLVQLSGETKRQSLCSSRPWIISKCYSNIRTGRKGRGFGRPQAHPWLARMPLLTRCPEQGLAMEPCLPPCSASGVPWAGHRQVMKHAQQRQVPVDQSHCSWLRIIFWHQHRHLFWKKLSYVSPLLLNNDLSKVMMSMPKERRSLCRSDTHH